MSSDTGITGVNGYVAFGGTPLNPNYREVGFSDSIGTVIASAGSDAGETRLTTLLDSNFSIQLKRPVGGTAQWMLLKPGASGTFEIGIEGTATGKPRAYVTAILKSKEVPFKYNDIIIETFNFEQNSATGVTYTTY